MKYVGFLSIARVLVPRNLANRAQEHLRAVGRLGAEGIALWAGQADGPVFKVQETIVPKQRAFQSEDGTCVTVDGEELFHINVHLHQCGRLSIAQLHTHPGEAYHSETDDAFPLVPTIGALSLVVPHFARDPFAVSACATYRLLPGKGWCLVSPESASQLIVLVE